MSKRPPFRPLPSLFEELEPRLLLSADGLGALVSGDARELDADGGDSILVHQEFSEAVSQEQPSSRDDVDTARREIVFVDGGVADHETLVAGFLDADRDASSVEVVVLDPARDGIEQITETLAGYRDLDAIHVLSHGDDVSLRLGSTTLDGQSLDRYQAAITGWAGALDAEADLLLYGCNLAAGEDGRALIAELAVLTGADVAASDDLTGSALLGGDWALEHRVGEIESEVAVQETWSQVLATYTVTTNAATGAGSLDEAITLANASVGVDDVIGFNIGGGGAHTIAVGTGGLPTITGTVALDATTQPGYSGTPLIRLDGASAGGGANGLTFASNSDASVVRGLMITRFSGFGIQVDSGANGVTIAGNWIGTTGAGSTGVGNTNNGINVQGANTVIGGINPGDGNVITNNNNEGINLTGGGATGTVIQGNIIGLDPDGATGSGNSDVGIAVLSGAHNTTIGGTVAAARNVISNNFEGIEINSNDNVVQGNYIGTDSGGTLDKGNHSDDGVEVQNSATGNMIGGTVAGAGNLIAFNFRDGVYIASGTGTAVLGNRIHSNSGLGIDLGPNGVTSNDPAVNKDADTGANNLQNYPVLVSASSGAGDTRIIGSLNSTAVATFLIEFFSSAGGDGTGHGEAQTYLGFTTVTTDVNGNASFNAALTGVTVTAGHIVSATATVDLGGGNYGSTSEFAQNVIANVNHAPTFIGGALGYWQFDEGSGQSAAESAIGVSAGTLGSTGGADANDPAWIAGRFGQALHFDGVNDYVEIADAPGIDVSGSEFSASLWMKPDAGPNTEDMLFMKGDRAGNVNYYLSWKNSGEMTWAFKDGAGWHYQDMAVTLPTTGQWNHVAITFDQPTVTLYVNGTKYVFDDVATGGSMDRALTANNEPLWIGAGRNGGSIVPVNGWSGPFAGSIDELAIFGRALTDVDVAAIRASGAPVATADAFVLDENSVNTTVVGAVTAADQDPGDTLTYAITGGNTGGAFAIDSNGQLTVANDAALDFETAPLFSLIVEASDDGTPSLTDTATVTITLNDVNEDPTGTGSLATTSLNDNVGPTNLFSGLTVSDADVGEVDLSVTITLTDPSSGALSGGGFIDLGAGVYRVTGLTVAQADTALDNVQFTPTNDTGPSGTFATDIGVTVNDQGGGGEQGVLGPTTVIITRINDNPTANNDAYTVNEDATLNVGWWDTAWTARQVLTFDNSAQSETLVDFPVLIALNPVNIDYAKTQNDGADLRFFAADGTALAYEIEDWNEAGDSFVWVRVPQIAAGSTIDSITMYYGNATASSAQDSGAVWSNGYSGVWHLDDDPALGAGAMQDSSANPLHGTAVNMDASDQVAGHIGGALDLDGSSEYIRVASDATDKLAISGNQITIEAWVKRTGSTGNWMTIANRQDGSGVDDSYVMAAHYTDPSTFILNTGDAADGFATSAAGAVPLNDWQYLTAVQDGSDMFLYSDGLLVGSASGLGAFTSGANDFIIGGGQNDPNPAVITEFFKGIVDEVRVSGVARSADWVAAQHASMTGGFVSFGGEESAPVSGGVLTNDTDVDGDAISVTAVDTTATLGLVTLNPDGTFTYDPNGQFESLGAGQTTTDSFSYTIDDGESGTDQATVTITIVGVNDDPTGAGSLTTTSLNDNAGASNLFGGLSVSDVDAGENDLSLTITLTDPTAGTLSGGGFIDLGGGVYRAMGLTVAQADTALDNVQFTPTDNTGPSGTFATDISVTVNDQDSGEQSVLGATTVTITRVNDNPTGAGSLTATNLNDNAGPTNLFGGLTVSDADVGEADLSLTITLTDPAAGTLSGGGFIDLGAGVYRATGLTVAQADTALDTVQFTPPNNTGPSGSFTTDISATVNDQGGGGEQSVLAPTTVTITRVNDAPTIGTNTLTISEGAGLVFTVSELAASDPDDDDSALMFTLSGITGGEFIRLSTGATVTTFSQADVTAGDLYFRHDGNEAAPGYTVSVSDGSLGDGPAVASVFFTNVNDAPVNLLPGMPQDVVSGTVDGATSVYAADIDGDGDVDLVSSSWDDDRVAWYQNDGAGGFTEFTIATGLDGARHVFVADVDGDGHLDVLASDYINDTVTWYQNDGTATPAFTAHLVTAAADGAWSSFAADIDGDGDTDILSASIWDDKIAWYENDGAASPGFTEHLITVNADGARTVIAGDLDGDGDIDVASASFVDDTIAWYENDGAPTPGFTEHVVSTNALGAMSVVMADIDADGDMDLASASYADGKIAWYANDGAATPAFAESVISTSAIGARDIHVADMDADGDLDVLSASFVDDKFAWYENDGAASPVFIERLVSQGGDGPRSVTAADIDGDGDLDVIGASLNDDEISVFENPDGEMAPLRTLEDTALVFSTANANLISVADVDAGAALVKLRLEATNGTVTLFSTTGLTVDIGTGSDDGIVEVRGTLADINAALDGLSFLPSANFVGIASLRIISDDLANSGTGGALTDDDTVNITVTPVNDDPGGSGTLVTTSLNDNAGATNLFGGLSVSDVDAGENDLSVTITLTNPAAGTISGGGFVDLGGGVYRATGLTVAQADTALDNVTFTPVNNTGPSGSFATDIGVTVNDQDSGEQSVLAPTTVTVTRVNDNPTGSGTLTTTSLNDNVGATNLFSGLTVSDVDSGENDLSLTITLTNPGAGTISGGGFVDLGGGVYRATGLTVAAADTALDTVTFTPTNNTGSSGIFATDIGVTVNDQDSGEQSVLGATTVTITRVNDNPGGSGSLTTTSLNDNAGATSLFGGLSVSDVDTGENDLSLTITLTNPGAGAVSGGGFIDLGAGVYRATGLTVAQADTALDNVQFTPTSNSGPVNLDISVTVNDQDSGEQSVLGPTTVTITGVNDNPTGAGSLTTTTLNDNVGASNLFGGLSVSDVDTGENDLSLTITLTDPAAGTVSGGGFIDLGGGVYRATGLTVAAADTALDNVQFTPTSNTGSSGTFTTDISVTVNDQGGGGEQNVLGATTVTITRVNDDPGGSGSLTTTSLNDNAGATNLFGGLSVSDVDAGENDLSLTITLTNPSAGTVSGGGFTDLGGGVYRATGLTVAAADTVLDNVQFTPTNNTGPSGTFATDISVTVNDQDSGEQSVMGATTVTSTRVNDNPTGSGTLTTTSLNDNAGATNLFGGLSVSDADAGENDLSLTITLTSPSAGTISGGGFVDLGGGVYRATGLTVAQADTALDNVTFTPTDNSGPSGTFGTDISVTVNDQGGGGEQSVLAATTVTITRVNDDPTGVGSLTTTSLNDNAGPTNLFGGLSVSDADAGENDLSLTITLTDPTAGTLSGGGFTETAPGGGVYRATGLTVAQADTALDNVTFTPTNNTGPSGTFSTDISVTVNDQGGGGEQSVLGPTTVTVTRVNDDPTGTGTLTTTALNDNAGATNLFGSLSVSDADAGENDLSLTITLTDPTAGTLSGGGFTETAPGSGVYTITGLSVAQADTALDNVQFTPTNNTGPSGTFSTDISVTVNDHGGGGEQSVLSATTVTIIRVNDNPTGSGSLTTTTLNDNVGASNLFGGLSVSDVDAGENDLSLTITLTDPTAGTLAGGGFIDLGGGVYRATGLTVAQADTALDNVTFTPTNNSGPSGSFATGIGVTVNDQDSGEQSVLGITTLTITRVNDNPTGAGTLSTTSLNDSAGATNLFGGLSVSDVDTGENDLSLTITLTNPSAGTLSGGGFIDLGAGVYRATGLTVVQADTALDNVQFTPTSNSGPVNLDISVTVNDQDSGEQSVLGPTTVTITGVNDNPTGAGTLTTTTLNDNVGASNLFGGLSVSDVDTGENDLSLTITLTDPSAGTLAGGGFTDLGGGVYRATGLTVAQADTALDSVQFTPTNNTGSSGTFTTDIGVTVNDQGGGGEQGVLGPTTVTITRVNDSPVGAGSLTTTSLDDNAGASSLFGGLSVGDVDAGENDLSLTITLTNPGAGMLAGGGFVDLGGGLYRATGLTVAQADTALDNVTFTPTDNSGPSGTFTTDISVTVNDQDSGEQSVLGATTLTITRINVGPVGQPVIIGTPTEDLVLSANTGGISDADGLGTFSYQWLRDGLTIGAATASSYTLGDADVGATITLRVDYTDGDGAAESVISVAVGPVVNVNDLPAGQPIITGTPTEDLVLTAVTAGIADADGLGTFSNQWLRDGVAVGGATGATYTLGVGDVGAQLSVAVTYTDAQGTPEGPIASASAALVVARPASTPEPASESTPEPLLEPGRAPDGEEPEGEAPPGPGVLDLATVLPEPREEPFELTARDNSEPEGEGAPQDSGGFLERVVGLLDVADVSTAEDHDDAAPGVSADARTLLLHKVQERGSDPISVGEALPLDLADARAADAALTEQVEQMVVEMAQRGEQQIVEQEFTQKVIMGTLGTLSVGTVTWLLRAGSLLTGVFSAIPMWTSMDPLPILSMSRKEQQRRQKDVAKAGSDDAAEQRMGRLLDGQTEAPEVREERP